jgi:hypothetical protein
MSFPQFPNVSGIEYPVGRMPIVDTNRLTAKSGRTTNLSNWPDVRYKHELGISYLSAAAARKDWQLLEGFWKQVMTSSGQYFQFSNPEDFAASAEVFGVGNSATTQYYLTRKLGRFVENMHAPRMNLLFEDLCNTNHWTLESAGAIYYAANIADPQGGSLAVQLLENTTTSVHGLVSETLAPLANTDYTVSLYAKSGTRTWIALRIQAYDAATPQTVYFNLSNGTVGTTVDVGGFVKNAFILPVAGQAGWYRLGFTGCFSAGAGTPNVHIYPASADNTNSYTGVAASPAISIYGGICEVGFQSPGFTADRTYASPFPLGPRVFYSPWQNANLNLPAARQNVLIWSEEYTNAAWTKVNCSAGSLNTTYPNQIVATKNAKLVETNANGLHDFNQTIASLGAATPYTYSVMVSGQGRTWCWVQLSNADGSVTQYVNLATGALGTTVVTGSLRLLKAITVQQVASATWYQIDLTVATASTTSFNLYIGAATADNTQSYTGTTSLDALYVYAAQLEKGSLGTLYIPTTTGAFAATDYTLDGAGLVTFTTAPTAVGSITWTGSFDWLCQFDDDSADFQNFLFNYWSLGKIKFTSARVP